MGRCYRAGSPYEHYDGGCESIVVQPKRPACISPLMCRDTRLVYSCVLSLILRIESGRVKLIPTSRSSSIQKPATPYPSVASAATIKRLSSHIFAQTSGKAGNDHDQFACLDWLRHMHLETRRQRPHSILTSGIRRQRHCRNAPSSLRP
jgi:hypothetical protein